MDEDEYHAVVAAFRRLVRAKVRDQGIEPNPAPSCQLPCLGEAHARGIDRFHDKPPRSEPDGVTTFSFAQAEHLAAP